MRNTARERAAQKLRQAANILAKAGHFGDDLNAILRTATKLEQEAGKPYSPAAKQKEEDK